MRQHGNKLDFKPSPYLLCPAHHPQAPALPQRPPDLGCHPTPEVGVRSPGIQHGGHHRLVLCDEQGQCVRVEDQVVGIYKLQNAQRGISMGQEGHLG